MSEPSPTRRSFYVVGGTMPPDSPSYVERKADAELLRRLRDREYCYVLTPRQMGKSSLMARTAKELRAQGIRTAIVDLTAIGGLKEHVTAAQWYYGFLHSLLREFRVEFDLERWWNGKENLPPLQRLTDFFDALLRLIEEPMAIFIDEIDTTIGLPFKDDFFAAIRAEHNARAFDPMRRRLTFVLLGVASPAELIQDTRRTPFNIGWPVELTDFTPSEALVLVQGLTNEIRGREAILDRVLYWTSGHPYLTQKLCRAVADEKPGDEDYSGVVDRIAGRNFLGAQAVRNEENLKFVASRLKHDGAASKSLLRLLTVIRHGGAVIYEPTSALHVALKLSGVVGLNANGKLAVRNRIYDHVFTANWARTGRALAGAWARRSLRHAAAGRRDHALLCRLRALEFEPSDYHWAEAVHLSGGDFTVLSATLRHSGPVTAVAWSPDGATILTASEDRTAQLWDASGMPKGAALRHKGPIWAAAFSPRGDVVATVSDDSMGRIWAVDSGLPVGPPLRHGKPAWVVQFSPGGDVLLTGSDDGTARLWDSTTGESKGIELSHPDAIEAAAFSPDGKIIAIASANNELRLWNAEDGLQLGPGINLGTRVTVVAFSADGSLLFTAGDDTTSGFWQVDRSASPPVRRAVVGEAAGTQLLRSVAHAGSIRAACFATGGSSILTGSEDSSAMLWDSKSAMKLAPRLLHEHWVRTVAITGDGDLCATGSEDKTACVWSLPSGAPLYQKLRHEARVVDVAFSPDEKMIATASHDGTARVWSVKRMKGGLPQAVTRHETRIAAAALSKDGAMIATASDGAARICADDSTQAICKPLPHGGTVRVVAFAPDGGTLLTGCEDGYVRLWGIADGELKYLLNHERGIRAAAFSEDGSVVASGSADIACIWKAGSEAAVLRHQGVVEAVEFSKDGKALVTVTDHNTARVWRVPDGELIAVLPHDGPVRAVTLTPDGRIVATGSEDKVRIWSAQTGNLLSATLPHGGDVNSLSFSPDGKILATGTIKGDLRLWSDFGAPLRKAVPHSEPIQSIFFTPDSKLTLCATESWLHVYKTSSGKAVVSRPLPGVWAGAWRFLPGPASRLRVIVRWTPDRALAANFDLHEAIGMPDDDPRDLLEKYSRRCGLRIDERDRIVPRWAAKANARGNLRTRNEAMGSS